jgi:hypothetical protein
MKSSPVKSLRQYVRIPFGADVLLKLHEKSFKVQLVDISLKGALVRCNTDDTVLLNDPCRLKLPMAQDGEGIVMAGHIAHLDGPLVGIACSDIDVASLTRLRRLIELNSGDSSLMHREIHHLFGDR